MTVQPGDLVRYTGPGKSVLDGGPGRVVSIDEYSARVEVLTACTVIGNEIHAGERCIFALDKLEVVA